MLLHSTRIAAVLLCCPLVGEVPSQSIRTAGLKDSVEILVDRWGVPHIYAKDLYDGYFAQGFNAASERLWQMDLWRKRGLGRLSQDFGPAYAAQDRAARLFLYRGDMVAEWSYYVDDMRQVLHAFTVGVNARVRMVQRDSGLLPWEFKFLNTAPALWEPEDLLRIRSAALASNSASEVARAQLACKSGANTEALRVPLSIPWTPILPDGTDVCMISNDILADVRLAKQTSVNFASLRAEARPPSAEPRQVESNNWAISAKRSATGRAILATDPHRPFQIPAFRYFAHVSAPGFDVVGFGEPQHPGFVFGHNGTIAWGQTTFQVDMEDIHVYETDPANPSAYRYKGQWEQMRTVREELPVKGGASREITLKFTRHGPVIHEAPSQRRAYALRAGWLEPGSATFMGSIGHNRARNWDEFQRELNRYRVPGNNVIYADSSGNVGLAPSGNAPRRPNWDGLLPVPGDGRYEWAGIRPNSELPRAYNPPEGYVASANNRPYFVDPNQFAAMKIGYEFGEERIERIREVLGAPGKISFAKALALQNDYTNPTARKVLPLLKGLRRVEDAKVRTAVRMLESWNMVMSKGSAAATLYELWSGELRGTRARDELMLVNTLGKAIARAENLLGANWKQWQWGKLHYLELKHGLSPLVDPSLRAKINAGGKEAGKGGIGNTVGNLGYGADFKITSGNSSRFVIDVGNWDASRFLHVPGQSGNPDSPEYRNLLDSWVREEYNPLLYSRRAIEAATIRRISLIPE